jgi:hypothetical protein
MQVVDTAVSTVKRATAFLAGLLPEPPADEPEPPDIDGKRRSTIDPEALRRIERLRKNGKGGNR